MSANALRAVRRYYEGKLAKYGAKPAGVDWKDLHAQQWRFEQLAKVLEGGKKRFSLNDLGCGYGAFYKYLLRHRAWKNTDYHGADISPVMVRKAQALWRGKRARFSAGDASVLGKADFTVASGVFNVKLKASRKKWETRVLRTIDAMWRKSRRGMAFNVLSAYSEKSRMRANLYYADPVFFFRHCRKLAKNVSLLHDYGFYEFTVLLRRDA